MPAVQPNKQWFRYTDGASPARNWACLVDQTWGLNVASGLAAFNAADAPFGPQSRRHRMRAIVYRDPATRRTFTGVVGTAAAMTALPATLAVFVPGEVAAITYNISRRIDEKLLIPQTSSNLLDHA
jgi:hypothetical protein